MIYSFANEYSGLFSWLVTEWPEAVMRHLHRKAGNEVRESRFGLYYYDVTGHARPKPIAHAMSFFRKYGDKHETGEGTIEITEGDTQFGAGYIFKAQDALFIGDRRYRSENLEFSSDKAANVMLIWTDGEIKLMSTCDVTIAIKPTGFAPLLTPSRATVSGLHGGLERLGERLQITLLEGEVITIQPSK